jgi:cytochrome o ubiquinol oxidase subunit 3
MSTDILHHDHHEAETAAKTIFGFWLFIMSDLIMFAAMFISYVVLAKHTAGSIGIKSVASLNYVLVESLFMFAATFAYGLGTVAMKKGKSCGVMFWMIVSLILGLVFAGMQWHLFSALYSHGYTWHKSAFLSVFYLLVGAQWFHLLAGLLWTLVLIIQLPMLKLTTKMQTRLSCLGLFWGFLNIVWICVFTIVFLMGAI